MKARSVITIVLFVLSEVVGIAIGEVFYRLFVSAVPPIAHSNFNMQASHVAHLGYGAGVGLVLFAWAMLGMGVGGMSRSGSKSQGS